MRPGSRWAALAAVAVVAAALSGCSGGAAQEIGATAKVERARIERRVVATGTIEPEKEVEVRPRVSGIVEKIHVKAGDVVRAGSPLVEIERELTAGRLDEARAQLEDARAELRFAEPALSRATRLHRDGAMDDQARDEIQTRFDRARAGVARGEATVRLLETELRYATVEAPIDGRILDVPIEVGSAVASVISVTGGTPLLSIASADTLHLKGLVDENEIAWVAVDQPARIRTEAYKDRTFAGRVSEIKPLGKREQNVTYFEVKVAVVDPDAQLLRTRMSGHADIIAEVVDGALVVPETALAYEGDDVFVDRVVARDPPKSERVRVKTGIVEDDRVQVVSGLDEGQEVKRR
ncbi:MAG TPA: efflux RND transporter periplasmic adaptor subunit [Candidatus Binatia bacterium]|nr:efflux RND transporter periplasmic adaptor subunit [Candidatus Binatia bacterium]